MSRISVVGNSATGKSTAARRIGAALGVPALELDSLRHLPNWAELPDDDFIAQVRAFMAKHDGWVIDGNYSIVRDEVWRHAEAVLWIDLPLWTNMRLVVQRTVRRLLLRTELWNGNREPLTNFLSRDPYRSIIAWTWTRHPVIRERYSRAMHDPRWSHLEFVRLRSHDAVDELVRRLQASGTPPARPLAPTAP